MKIKADDKVIKVFGRTFYNEKINAHVFGWTCSGFYIRFMGTSLKACLLSNNPEVEGKKAYITVLTDKEKYKVIKLDKAECIYTLCENLEYKEHTVKVVKRSEACFSYAAVKELETDGIFLEPDNRKCNLKIEFIGDSITCGYGNVAKEINEPFSTASEDGLQTYASFVANDLNAEANMISVSGWALYKSPYGRTIPEIYSYTDYFNDKKRRLWDFSSFIPDFIVLALGSNDNAYCLSEEVKLNEFEVQYIEFLKRLRVVYPKSHIICIIGTLIDSDSDIIIRMDRAVKTLNDKKIEFLKLPKVNVEEDGLGSNHPTVKTHKKDATVLLNRIKEIM